MVGFVENDTITENQKLIAGSITGCVTRTFTQPIDVMKIKIQLMQDFNQNRQSLISVFRRIVKDSGYIALTRGHSLGQVHSIMAMTSQFYLYELCTKKVHRFHGTNLEHITLFLSGVVAGGTTTFLTSPLEVIRIRQVVAADQYRGFFRGAKAVYETGGIPAFYSGVTAAILQTGPSIGIAFMTFRLTQSYLLTLLENKSKNTDTVDPTSVTHVVIASTLAGALSGLISKTVTYPFELAKRRLQMGTHKSKEPAKDTKFIQCNSLLECLVKTYKNDGFLGLFRGWKVTMFKAQVTSIVAFTSYESVCYIVRHHF